MFRKYAETLAKLPAFEYSSGGGCLEEKILIFHGPSPESNKKKLEEYAKKLYRKKCGFLNCEKVVTIRDLKGYDQKLGLLLLAFCEIEISDPVLAFLRLDKCNGEKHFLNFNEVYV